MLQIYKKKRNIERMRNRKNSSQRKRPVKRLLDDVLPKRRPQSKPVVNPELTEEEESGDEVQKEKGQSDETTNEAVNVSASTLERDEEASSPVQSVVWLSQQVTSSRDQLTQQSK